jgi:NAD(P)-dependent dehydrogenase (short-subunit alcohol dehydrogenase family)
MGGFDAGSIRDAPARVLYARRHSRKKRIFNVKTALITGANKGVGYETVRRLATEGFQVFVGARNADAGRKAADTMAKNGAKATFLQLDVSDPESVTAAPGEFSKFADHLDVLVNNAGILLDGDSTLLTISDDLIRKTLETNTLGPLRVTRAFAPLLAKSGAPRVINVSSGGGQLTGGADGWAPAYCISKTALNGVTSQLAVALPKFAVNSVCPRLGSHRHGGSGAPRSVEEGADTIVWLATEAPQNLTGNFLRDRHPIAW